MAEWLKKEEFRRELLFARPQWGRYMVNSATEPSLVISIPSVNPSVEHPLEVYCYQSDIPDVEPNVEVVWWHQDFDFFKFNFESIADLVIAVLAAIDAWMKEEVVFCLILRGDQPLRGWCGVAEYSFDSDLDPWWEGHREVHADERIVVRSWLGTFDVELEGPVTSTFNSFQKC